VHWHVSSTSPGRRSTNHCARATAHSYGPVLSSPPLPRGGLLRRTQLATHGTLSTARAFCNQLQKRLWVIAYSVRVRLERQNDPFASPEPRLPQWPARKSTSADTYMGCISAIRVLAVAQSTEGRDAKRRWDETLRGNTPDPGWTTRLGDMGRVLGITAVAVGKLLE
jgi:hypothetical protein